MDRAYEEKLFHSCRTLFGPQAEIGWDFLYYIQLSGIKSAFRERALHTHPDRVHIHGDTSGGQEMFIAAREAYEHLTDFIRRRGDMRPARKKAPRYPAARKKTETARPKKPAPAGGFHYEGALPWRKLMLGEYLFYGGHISWEALIKAIVWQRRQRPRFGDLACAQGLISRRQARAAAARKKLGTPIGEELVRSGLLSRKQVRSLVWKQRFMQRMLGEYFVRHGHLTKGRLSVLAEECRRHNLSCSPAGI